MNVSEFGGILRKMGFCRCLASVLCPVPVITGTRLLLIDGKAQRCAGCGLTKASAIGSGSCC